MTNQYFSAFDLHALYDSPQRAQTVKSRADCAEPPFTGTNTSL
jgi:hypothetical protein